jgi:hypothetical protein
VPVPTQLLQCNQTKRVYAQCLDWFQFRAEKIYLEPVTALSFPDASHWSRIKKMKAAAGLSHGDGFLHLGMMRPLGLGHSYHPTILRGCLSRSTISKSPVSEKNFFQPPIIMQTNFVPQPAHLSFCVGSPNRF